MKKTLAEIFEICEPVAIKGMTLPSTMFGHDQKPLIVDDFVIYKMYNDSYYKRFTLQIYNKGYYQTVYLRNGTDNLEVEVLSKDSKIYQEFKEYSMKNLELFLGHDFTIGSDPEMFVEDKDGVIIPAFNFLGSAEKPSFTANDVRNHGGKPLYWDGFQAEFQTSVGTCLGWLTDSVQLGIKGLIIEARKHNPNAKLSTKTTIDIPMDMLMNSAPEHVAFGCTPSLNVYGMKGIIMDGRAVPFRSAGGHIHFGCGKAIHKKPEVVARTIKALDAVLGVACVSMFASFDDPRRRTMYGLAGEYRLPKHGIEYRTLSNAWMFHPMIMNLVFDLSRKAFMFGHNGYLHFWKGSEEETIEVINTCNVSKAREILERNKVLFLKLLNAAYGNHKNIELAYNVFLNGMESAVKDPTAIEKNWNVDDNWVDHSYNNGEGKTWSKAYPLLAMKKKVS